MRRQRESPGPAPLREPLFCPLCCAGYTKLLVSNLELRTAEGGVHSIGSRRLAAYLCREGHVFLVCECDLQQHDRERAEPCQ
jgi:hypothetical protein